MFMITCSYDGFLRSAGHVWRTSPGIASGIALGLARMWKKGTILSFARKHEWTNCSSRYCKVSLLVVHHIAFHCLEPLSRKKSASQEDSYMKSLAGFSDAIACNTVTLLALSSLLSSGCFSWVWWVVKRLEHNMQKCDPWILQPSKHSWEKCYLHPSDHSGTVCMFALGLQIKLLSPHLSCLASLNSWYALNRSKWVQYGAM